MKLSKSLEIILYNVDSIKIRNVGLCHMILFFLRGDDCYNAEKYIKDNKPFTLYSYFSSSNFWWKPGRVRPRKKWLEKHIKKLQKKGL